MKLTRETFIAIAILYYFISMVIVIILLVLMDRKYKKSLNDKINNLERDKNLIISSNILSE